MFIMIWSVDSALFLAYCMQKIGCGNITKFHYTTTFGKNDLLVKIEPKPYTKQKRDLNFVTTFKKHQKVTLILYLLASTVRNQWSEYRENSRLLYLHEIVVRTSERHFEGNHYVIAHKSKMNVTKNESGCNLVTVIRKVFHHKWPWPVATNPWLLHQFIMVGVYKQIVNLLKLWGKYLLKIFVMSFYLNSGGHGKS